MKPQWHQQAVLQNNDHNNNPALKVDEQTHLWFHVDVVHFIFAT